MTLDLEFAVFPQTAVVFQFSSVRHVPIADTCLSRLQHHRYLTLKLIKSPIDNRKFIENERGKLRWFFVVYLNFTDYVKLLGITLDFIDVIWNEISV